MPPPSGKRGHRCRFSDAAIQTCLALMVLFGMPMRQTTGVGESLLRVAGLDRAQASLSSKLRFDCRAMGGSKRRLPALLQIVFQRVL